jgi:hypothetical protein
MTFNLPMAAALFCWLDRPKLAAQRDGQLQLAKEKEPRMYRSAIAMITAAKAHELAPRLT